MKLMGANKLKKLIFIILLITKSSTAMASYFLYLEIERSDSSLPEIGFMKADNKEKCIAAARKITESKSITSAFGGKPDAKVQRTAAKCVRSNMEFSDYEEHTEHVYLVRFIAGMPSLTEMDSIESCKESQSNYSNMASRKAFCAISAQAVIFQ